MAPVPRWSAELCFALSTLGLQSELASASVVRMSCKTLSSTLLCLQAWFAGRLLVLCLPRCLEASARCSQFAELCWFWCVRQLAPELRLYSLRLASLV